MVISQLEEKALLQLCWDPPKLANVLCAWHTVNYLDITWNFYDFHTSTGQA